MIVQTLSNNIVRRHLLKSNTYSAIRSSSATSRGSTSSSMSSAASSTSSSSSHVAQDLDFAKSNVRKYDPAGMLPGHLLYTDAIMQTSYFAVRSFWVETGLRFAAKSGNSSSSSTTSSSVATGPPSNATPSQHLDWWQEGIEKFVFSSSSNDDNDDEQQHYSTYPTLRLLRHLVQDKNVSLWTKGSFEAILDGRRKDLDVVKQYETLDQLVQHAEQSCGNLTKLVIQSGVSHHNHNAAIMEEETANQSYYESLYEAARLVGICHGLTNALRTSIPVISLSGKLIIPAELTLKHGVKSPRYLLSALGQGSDDKCVRALQACVQDIVNVARQHLQQARDLRPAILQEIATRQKSDTNNKNSRSSRVMMATLLPGVASETFLNRLEQSDYQLTDSNLRHVGLVEHATCAARMISAYCRQIY